MELKASWRRPALGALAMLRIHYMELKGINGWACTSDDRIPRNPLHGVERPRGGGVREQGLRDQGQRIHYMELKAGPTGVRRGPGSSSESITWS